jgi:hypothetical protein
MDKECIMYGGQANAYRIKWENQKETLVRPICKWEDNAEIRGKKSFTVFCILPNNTGPL